MIGLIFQKQIPCCKIVLHFSQILKIKSDILQSKSFVWVTFKNLTLLVFKNDNFIKSNLKFSSTVRTLLTGTHKFSYRDGKFLKSQTAPW